MHDRLYYAHVYVGEIVTLDEDFPNRYGSFRFGLLPNDALAKRVLLYMYDSMLTTGYVPGYEMQLAEWVEKHGWKTMHNEWQLEKSDFMDLIESKGWRLVEINGNVIPLLAPVFRSDQTIVWRMQ
jgi:hypothetical protein